MAVMNVKTPPAYARRVRLSTTSILAAVLLTCAALIAIGVAVGPTSDTTSAVPLVGPVSRYNSGAL